MQAVILRTTQCLRDCERKQYLQEQPIPAHQTTPTASYDPPTTQTIVTISQHTTFPCRHSPCRPWVTSPPRPCTTSTESPSADNALLRTGHLDRELTQHLWLEPPRVSWSAWPVSLDPGSRHSTRPLSVGCGVCGVCGWVQCTKNCAEYIVDYSIVHSILDSLLFLKGGRVY